MDWQTITIAGFIALAFVLVLYFSVKEPRSGSIPSADFATADLSASQITTHVQRELKGTKDRMENIEFNQRKLSDKIDALHVARGIDIEQVKYLTQNAS